MARFVTESDVLETNAALLALATNSTDEAAWKVLFVRFWPYVLSIAFRVLKGNRQLSEEVAQESFLRVLQRCPSFDGMTEQSFRAYLGTIARNIAIDTIRKMKREPSSQLQSDPIAAAEATTQLDEEFDKLLAPVQPKDRQILDLILQGLPIREIADLTQLTPNNIGVRLYRIRKMLRKRIEQ